MRSKPYINDCPDPQPKRTKASDEIIKQVEIEELEMELCVSTSNQEEVWVGVDFYGNLTKDELLSVARQIVDFAGD